jgi:hypothetical protein
MPVLFTGTSNRPNFATPSEIKRCAVSGSPMSSATARIFGSSDGLIDRAVATRRSSSLRNALTTSAPIDVDVGALRQLSNTRAGQKVLRTRTNGKSAERVVIPLCVVCVVTCRDGLAVTAWEISSAVRQSDLAPKSALRLLLFPRINF